VSADAAVLVCRDGGRQRRGRVKTSACSLNLRMRWTQATLPESRSEQGSMVVYRSRSSVGSDLLLYCCLLNSEASLSRAHCSACVLPANSLENPVARISELDVAIASLVGQITHPTQKAVSVGGDLSAWPSANFIIE
jgi:hypothetical protein